MDSFQAARHNWPPTTSGCGLLKGSISTFGRIRGNLSRMLAELDTMAGISISEPPALEMVRRHNLPTCSIEAAEYLLPSHWDRAYNSHTASAGH